MRDFTLQCLNATPCKEHHREYWLPRPRRELGKLPPGVTLPEKPRLPGAPDPSLTQKRWGSLVSTMGEANDEVENLWALRSLQSKRSEEELSPMEKKAIRKSGKPLNSYMFSQESPGVSSCFVGGTTVVLRSQLQRSLPDTELRGDERQVGHYEDHYRRWDGHYWQPEYGLGQSPISQYASEMVRQEALRRKFK